MSTNRNLSELIYWVDDERNPKDYFGKEVNNVMWFRDFDAFKKGLNLIGVPAKISFDHDLGTGKDGYDCAKYLVEYCEKNGCKMPDYYCHSANPSGRLRIISYLDSYMKSLKL